MGNGLLLAACILCFICAIAAFKFDGSQKGTAAVKIIWILTVAAVVAAVVIMIALQLSCRFEYRYVCDHISRDMAVVYKISALWSGQEGSFLLWALDSAVMGLFILPGKKKDSGRVFGIYALICLCVFVMCFISRPFEMTAQVPIDGVGLNAALKDPWMVVHPPLVFIAYSAMAVLFSLSAVIRKSDPTRQIVFWLRISWIFLGAGIMSGSVWAYRALDWGGYWAWDPIENAALVPWLLICGYLHRKTRVTYSVCLVPFITACIGVFFARSGILENLSAHAYSGGNIAVSVIILAIIAAALTFLIAVKVYNRKKAGKTILSESGTVPLKAKLFTWVIFGYAALIFIGTAAPIFIRSEMPVVFYNAVSVVFIFAYSALLLVQNIGWLKKRWLYMTVISTLIVVGIIAVSHSDRLGWLLLLWICFMPASLWLASGFPNGWKYYLTHTGISLLIIGAVASSALCAKGYLIAQNGGTETAVSGTKISVSELTDSNDTLIKNTAFSDIIIQRAQMTATSDGGYLVPYETKPLIILFWVGGFITVFAPAFYIISDRIKNKKIT
jgi:Cytochrome c biogenesis factor